MDRGLRETFLNNRTAAVRKSKIVDANKTVHPRTIYKRTKENLFKTSAANNRRLVINKKKSSRVFVYIYIYIRIRRVYATNSYEDIEIFQRGGGSVDKRNIRKMIIIRNDREKSFRSKPIDVLSVL